MLSIFLAEELEQKVRQSRNAFLQYFCDNKDEKRKTAVAIVRGLIYQLLRLRPKLFKHILPTFKAQKESLFSVGSFESLWRIFKDMIYDSALDTVYCVVDGLDECDEASLEVLLNKLKSLFSTQLNESPVCHLNLIVVSRDFPDFIPDTLSTFPRIRLDPDADIEINDDISRFIEVKVNELSEKRRYPEPIRERVKKVFQDRAQGTFLWVGIVASALTKYKASEVEGELDRFPSGLAELYARMLLQIEDKHRPTVAKILTWVAMAVRPLTLSELSVAIEDNVQTHFSRDQVMRDKLSYCGYFITIKGNEVNLIHQSAKDYLLRQGPDSDPRLEFFRIEEKTGNLEIARKCFNYLQSGCLAEGHVQLVGWYGESGDTPRLETFPLLSYAVLHWIEHAKNPTESEEIFYSSHPFYQKESQTRDSWLKTYWRSKGTSYLEPSHFTLLHIASYFGIRSLAQQLLLKGGVLNKLKRPFYLNKKDTSFRKQTALSWAADRGHQGVVKLLLEKGAAVDLKNSDGETALCLAAYGGHEAVVKMLLEKGAAVDLNNSDGETALSLAAGRGHEAVVKLLLEQEASVDLLASGMTPW